MNKSKIQWTDRTWNVIRGCLAVSEGCRNCYAAAHAFRFSGPGMPFEDVAVRRQDRAVFTGKIQLLEHKLVEPLQIKKPCKIFVNSMSDVFHEDVPFEFVDKIFAVMALCPHLTFQILTKRPERMAEYFNASVDESGARPKQRAAMEALEMVCVEQSRNPKSKIGKDIVLNGPAMHCGFKVWPLPNVWLGVSVENQAAADERILHLLRCPARVRFLSCEPLLEEIDINDYLDPIDGGYVGRSFIDWVIVGGESGPGARPCDVKWIRSIIEQCQDAGVAVFVKQLGAMGGYQGSIVNNFPGVDSPYAFTTEKHPGWTFWGSKSRKGDAVSEWPEDLFVQEFPKVAKSGSGEPK